MARLVAAIILASALAAKAAWAETPAERGAYLVRAVAACGACHTDRTPGAAELAGGQKFLDIAYTARAANLTPDPEFGVGKWSDDELVAGIREGRRPHGSTIGPPMPISAYRGMSDDDARAIVAFLRSLPASNNRVPHSTYRIALPDSYGPPLGVVPAPPDTDPVAYGAYLAKNVAHCMECHSRRGPDGAPDYDKGLGAGGAEFHGPWGLSIAPNITPNGIGYYTDADLRKLITTGVRPDGSKLNPPMPVAAYAHMNDKDLTAIIAFLRTLQKR